MVVRLVTGQAAAVAQAWRVSQGMRSALEKVVLVAEVEMVLMMLALRRAAVVAGQMPLLGAFVLVFVSLMVLLEPLE